MTVMFLITVTDGDAKHIERWCDEAGIRVTPASGHPGFGVPVIDVVANPEGPGK